jgi:hypothetical protein
MEQEKQNVKVFWLENESHKKILEKILPPKKKLKTTVLSTTTNIFRSLWSSGWPKSDSNNLWRISSRSMHHRLLPTQRFGNNSVQF